MKTTDWEYVDCKMISHDRMFWVHRQEPNLVKVCLKGAYPKNVPGGQDARPILFQDTFSDATLYQLMIEKNRKRSKKIAEMCKEAVAASHKE